MHRVLAAFEDAEVEYVVFGGVAINLHGLGRATEDLDVFIRPEARNVARLKAALLSVFEDPAIDAISADDLLGEYPAVQYVPPTGGFHVDILTRLGEAFDFAGLAVERIDFDGVEVTVVTPQQLYAMKRGTVRYKDRIDAAALAERYGLDDGAD